MISPSCLSVIESAVVIGSRRVVNNVIVVLQTCFRSQISKSMFLSETG